MIPALTDLAKRYMLVLECIVRKEYEIIQIFGEDQLALLTSAEVFRRGCVRQHVKPALQDARAVWGVASSSRRQRARREGVE